MRYVQKAPDDIRWRIDRNEFDELTATKSDSAPGPDGIPFTSYRVCGGIGFAVSLQRVQTYSGGRFYPCVIPKSSDLDNNGRIVRSPEAPRPWTLCNFDCKILTTQFVEAFTGTPYVYILLQDVSLPGK